MTAIAAAAAPVTTRERLGLLENEIRKHPGHITELPLRHFFVPGVYAREIQIPADMLAVGRIHKYPQINILSKGDLSVLTDDGWIRVEPPFTIVSPAGTKRLVFAHSDVVWTTIVATDETDLEKIEQLLTVATEAEYHAFLEHCRTKEISQCPS